MKTKKPKLMLPPGRLRIYCHAPGIRFLIGLIFISPFTSIVKSQETVYGMGHLGPISVLTSSDEINQPGAATLGVDGFLPNLSNASRFLAQATLGYTYEDVIEVSNIGPAMWIEGQFSKPLSSTLLSEVSNYHQYRKDSLNDPEASASIIFWDFAWWQYHMSFDDLLRQRIALALSEILVISRFSSFGDNPYAFSSYYDIFLRNAFGNYRDILDEVSHHAGMGVYLTFMNNPKSDPEENRFPDENYAREVMQLFTIGLHMLNIDGTYIQDQNGNKIPTYGNDEIAEFSKVFTGFMWGDRSLEESRQFFRGARADTSYAVPMQMNNEYHEPGPKSLLYGSTIPDRNPVDGEADVSDAIDNLFHHPNVGPFLAKLMIQRLVTSNPSTGYIQRVAKAFNDNGEGTRGDMKAFIRAILMDPEARICDKSADIAYGMLREPFNRYIQVNKAFNLSTLSGKHRNAMYNVYEFIEQKPFTSPSVFNFFQPDHQPIGPIEEADLVAPEFQITNSQTITGYLNGLHRWILNDKPTDEWNLYSGEDVGDDEHAYFDFTDEIPLAANETLHILIDRLNLILAQGNLSERTTDLIINGLKEFNDEDIEDLEDRVRLAIYLVMSAPEYLINR